MTSVSMFKAYLKEREGVDLIEREDGFAIYLITGQECYIRDIYTQPESRKTGTAGSMADEIAEIARAAGCKYLTGSVYLGAKGADASAKVLMAYGMRLHKTVDNGIIFIKDL